MLQQIKQERMRAESIVSKKMDTVLAAKQEADRKYENQLKELEELKK